MTCLLPILSTAEQETLLFVLTTKDIFTRFRRTDILILSTSIKCVQKMKINWVSQSVQLLNQSCCSVHQIISCKCTGLQNLAANMFILLLLLYSRCGRISYHLAPQPSPTSMHFFWADQQSISCQVVFTTFFWLVRTLLRRFCLNVRILRMPLNPRNHRCKYSRHSWSLV